MGYEVDPRLREFRLLSPSGWGVLVHATYGTPFSLSLYILISVYVDASCTDCIDLAFQLGQTSTTTRQWSIKVLIKL